MNDSGNIKCVATNILGRATTVANLQIEASPRLELPENYNDGLIFRYDEVISMRSKNENNQQLLLSQVIRMKIPVIAKPPPRITWFFDDEPVAVNEDVQVGKINLFLLFLLFIILNCLVLLVNIILLTCSCRSRSRTLSPA